jgi:hypothetical protein
MYYECQSGSLCRKHALNAYFGYEKISIPEFYRFQESYDLEYKKKFNINESCKDFDIVGSNQKNLVSYILKEFNIYSKYYTLNELFQKDVGIIIKILIGNFFFIYNESHIYGIAINNGKWYSVDSIGGIKCIDINQITYQKNIGFIIPADHKTEFYNSLLLLKSIIKYNSIEFIIEFLNKLHTDKRVLGDIEIPLSLCVDIWEFQLKKICKVKKINQNISHFKPIYNNICRYNEFLSKFTKGRYNDIILILEYLPPIITVLLSLSQIP